MSLLWNQLSPSPWAISCPRLLCHSVSFLWTVSWWAQMPWVLNSLCSREFSIMQSFADTNPEGTPTPCPGSQTPRPCPDNNSCCQSASLVLPALGLYLTLKMGSATECVVSSVFPISGHQGVLWWGSSHFLSCCVAAHAPAKYNCKQCSVSVASLVSSPLMSLLLPPISVFLICVLY